MKRHIVTLVVECEDHPDRTPEWVLDDLLILGTKHSDAGYSYYFAGPIVTEDIEEGE